MRIMRLVVPLVVGTASCGGITTRHAVAVGASGKLPNRGTSCRVRGGGAAAPVRIESGRFYSARAPGRAEIDCDDDDSLVFDVREVARLGLSRRGGGASSGLDPDGYVSLLVTAYDRNGMALMLGDSTPIDWEIPAALERRPGCHGDILPACDPSFQIAVRPVRVADRLVVVARLGGKQAALDLGERIPRPAR
jgi:hypothetical protein